MILEWEVASAALRLTFGVESLQDYHFFCLFFCMLYSPYGEVFSFSKSLSGTFFCKMQKQKYRKRFGKSEWGLGRRKSTFPEKPPTPQSRSSSRRSAYFSISDWILSTSSGEGSKASLFSCFKSWLTLTKRASIS